MTHYWIRAAVLASAALMVGVAAAQTAAPQNRDNDITRTELRNFDTFLDSHPQVAKELQRNPALVNDPAYLAKHPGLQQFLAKHPGVREEIRENPQQFMNREHRWDKNHEGITRGEVARFDEQYLDKHPEVAEQLAKNPKLIDNRDFVEDHPGLREYLAHHPEIREQLKKHPEKFMKKEAKYEKQEEKHARRAARNH
jgi:phage-related protein